MIDDIKIEPLNLDGLIEPLPSASRRTTPHLPALLNFLYEKGLTPGSTTSGRHNSGSKHYTGNAVDIKGSGGFSDAQVLALSQEAAARGFRLRDERTRPPRQAVWGGPHVHLEYVGMPSSNNDNLNLDGLIEPLDVEGLTESVVPPVPARLSTDDTEWHFGETIPNPSRRAMRVLQEAVAEDERKKKLYGHVDPPDIGYQNRMRAKAGLPQLQAGPTLRAATAGTQEERPLGGNPLMPVVDREQAFANAEAIKQAEDRQANKVRSAVQTTAPPGFSLLPKSAQEWIGSVMAQGAGDLTNLTAGIVRSVPSDPFDFATKSAADKVERVGNEISQGAQIMDRQAARGRLSQTAKDVLGGTVGSSPVYALMALGVPPPLAFGLHTYLMESGHDAGLLDTLTETTKAATIGALFELPLPAKQGILNEVGRRVAKAGIVGGGTASLNLLQGRGVQSDALVNALFAASGGKRHESTIPEVPQIDAMPNIPEVPVSTISEPRVVKRTQTVTKPAERLNTIAQAATEVPRNPAIESPVKAAQPTKVETTAPTAEGGVSKPATDRQVLALKNYNGTESHAVVSRFLPSEFRDDILRDIGSDARPLSYDESIDRGLKGTDAHFLKPDGSIVTVGDAQFSDSKPTYGNKRDGFVVTRSKPSEIGSGVSVPPKTEAKPIAEATGVPSSPESSVASARSAQGERQASQSQANQLVNTLKWNMAKAKELSEADAQIAIDKGINFNDWAKAKSDARRNGYPVEDTSRVAIDYLSGKLPSIPMAGSSSDPYSAEAAKSPQQPTSREAPTPQRGVKEQISYQAKRQQVVEALARDEFPYKGWDKDFPDLAAERLAATPQEAPKDLRRQFDDLMAASDRAYEEAKQASRARDEAAYKTKTEEAHRLAAQAREIMKQLPATEQAEIKSSAIGSMVEGFAKLGRAPKTAEPAALPELQRFADQAAAVRQKAANPNLTSFERAAVERKASRLEAKARGEELRHAGVDPSELLDDIIIRGGEIIRAGKASFDEWSTKLRAEFGPEASAHLKNVWAQLTSPIPDVPRLEDSTGIKHAVVEAERELQGLPQFAKARRAHGKSFDEGVYDVQSGRIKPRELASDIVKAFYDPKFSMERFQSRRPRPLSTEESMALLYDRMRISNERKAAEAELEAANEAGDAPRTEKALDEVSRLQQASNANDEADYVAGGEQGRGLAIRREMIKDDFSRARVLSQALALNKGKPLPTHITAALEEKVAELAKANERIAELESKQQVASAHSEIEKVIEKTQREVRAQSRRRNRQVLDTEAASIKEQIAAAWKRTRSGVQPSGLAGLDPEGELTKLLGMLARNRVEAGISKAADLVDAVHEMVKDVADLTKRDVQDLISGYGKTSKPKQDEIATKLSELKAIMRVSSGKADVVEKGIRPLRSGFQRPKPTQELREALRDLRDTLREHGIEIEKSARSPEDQQKSILDAAKTNTRNRIEDLTKWIAEGKRTVANKTVLIPDAELKILRAERDRLQNVFDAIDDPEADQRTITRALGAANKSILALEAKIESGEIAPKTKDAQPTSPELEAARAAQKTLQDILRDMRTAARKAAKPAEDSIVAEARKVLAAQKAFMTRNQKQMIAMQQELVEAKRIAKEGGRRPEKAKRTPVSLTDEMRVAKRNANQLRRDIDNVYSVIDWANKTKTQKGFAYAAAGVRAGVLSGVRVLAKIGGALGQRIPQQYVEELIGTGLSKIVPGAEKAPRHGGGMSAKAEADYLRGLASGAMEAPSILKTGESELSLEHGKRYPNIPTKLGTVLSIPGRVHAAEKNPLKVAEYNRSLERNLQWAERQGMERSNPDVIEQAKDRAYKDANEIILLGDNPLTRSLTNMQRGWKDESRSVFRMFVPVAKVPSNYLSQMVGDYGLGLVRGGVRALRQRNPELLEKLTPEEADKTMRLLKRGSLGLIYMALAGSGAGGGITAGGFWAKKKRGERRTVEPGDIQIGPMTISHLWLHSPPDELAQLAGTMRREIENRAARKEPIVNRVATGTAQSAKGVLDEVPFLNRYTRTYDSFRNGDTLLKMLGDTLAGWVEPQIVQELAKATDREEKGKPTIIPWKGEAVQRKAKTFGDAFLVGLPMGRQHLKKDRKKMMEMRQQERRGGTIPPVPGALNLNGLVEPAPSPTP